MRHSALRKRAVRRCARSVAPSSATPQHRTRFCTLRRLRTDQLAIGRATQQLWPAVLQERLGQPLAALGAALEAQLLRLAEATAAREGPPERAALMQAFAAFEEALQRCRSEGLLRGIPIEPVSSLFALGFALEQLKGEFDLLDARLAELAVPPVPLKAS